MVQIDKAVNLSDIILDDLKNIHIDATGTFIDTGESINIEIDISDIKNARIETVNSDKRNPITGKIVNKKEGTISFEDHKMKIQISK